MIFLLALRRDGGQVDSRIGKKCLAGEKAAVFLQKVNKTFKIRAKKTFVSAYFPSSPRT